MAFVVTVFDTETTGLLDTRLLSIDKQPQIIEFMAIKLNLDTEETIREYEFLAKPTKPITDEITKITGITNEMVENEPPFATNVDQVIDALENSDAVIAHNLSFDKEIVEIELERCGLKIKWPRLICTVEQTIPMKGYRLSLTDLHKEIFNEPFSGAHRARQDVEALVKCVLAINKLGYI